MISMTNTGTYSRSNVGAGLMGTDYRFVDGKLRFNTQSMGITGAASGSIAGFLFRDFLNDQTTNTRNVNHKGGTHNIYYPIFVKQ